MFSVIASILSGLFYFALHPVNSGSYPKPLTAIEEEELLIKTANGDKKAREKLIEHNLRLVAHVAKKYSGKSVETDDLISIGTIGLIKAVSSFKMSKGIRLATYAARCIDNEILMYLRNIKKQGAEVSISEPIDCDREGNDLTLIDVIADSENIEDRIDLKIKGEHLKLYIDEVLTEREKKIIFLRYGLVGGKEFTQNEVAARLNISRSYVSRIEKKALKKLNERFNK